MTQLEKIQHEILQLPQQEFINLQEWFAELAWEKWDEEFEEDVAAGKLNFLIEEAMAAKSSGTLRDL